MRFEELNPEDYIRARDAAPVAYIPWGAHEWHGRHNSLGLDALKALGQCLELCAVTGGVVFPPVYCGTNTMKENGPWTGTLEFSRECVRMLALEHLRQVASEGFRVAVVLMGHYGAGHVEVITDAARQFNAEQDSCAAWAVPDHELTAQEGFPAEHAALCETSYLLYFRPGLVDLARLPSEGELTWEEHGIHGQDPRAASPAHGREGVQALVRTAAPRILEMLREKTAPSS